MKTREIENWALEIISRVEKQQPVEDTKVELKSCWPQNNAKTARQIAAHANSAMGEDILWLIGIDEKDGVQGVGNEVELSNWYSSIKQYFNELSPRLISVNVPRNELIVVALLFETDRLPFVVKNPMFGGKNGGSVAWEVPWREGNSTQSARRSDLIRMLSPLEKLPDVEIIDKGLSATIKGQNHLGNYQFDALHLKLEMYIIPKGNRELVIPYHRCKVEFTINEIGVLGSYDGIEICLGGGPIWAGSAGKPQVLRVESSTNEIIIKGPSMVTLFASGMRPNDPRRFNKDVNIVVSFIPAGAYIPKVLNINLPYPDTEN